MSTKLCRDCANYNDFGGLCVRGMHEIGRDLVTGHPEYAYKTLKSAREERAAFMPWRCGKKGRNFVSAKLTGRGNSA